MRANGASFNSRARKGRDARLHFAEFLEPVSIHAPARSATHAKQADDNAMLRVSIHAPARGATIGQRVQEADKLFQFTRPQGARPGTLRKGATRNEFQFTRPQGARPLDQRNPLESRRCFNSRARKGRDKEELGKGDEKMVSIHAPARGATCASRTHCRSCRRFNSRARKGRDRQFRQRTKGLQFQFTRPQGARRTIAVTIGAALCLNSRARKGRDLVADSERFRDVVSIHAPARGATRKQE